MITDAVREIARKEGMVIQYDGNHSDGPVYVAEKMLSDGQDYYVAEKVRDFEDADEQLEFMDIAILGMRRAQEQINQFH